MTKTYYLTLFLIIPFLNQAQTSFASQVPLSEKYDPKKVVDELYGISIYDKLVAAFGNDTIRLNKKGYKVEGDIEDFYIDNKTIHKGFYVEGKLRAFKNFYPNNSVERSFKMIDLKRSEMVQYYPNGNLKSEISFLESYVVKQKDYFENGKISYEEESNKNADYLIKRNSYHDDGKPSITLELIDKKKRIYQHKEFYENGNLKEEGTMKYIPDMGDFLKEGNWITYNSSGKEIKKQFFHDGNISDE